MLKKYGTLLFLLLLFLHCFFIYSGNDDLRTATKLLLVPFLIMYLYAVKEGKIPILAVTGLVCSFAGDLLLTRSGELFFLFGMLAFILTHFSNGILFYKWGRTGRQMHMPVAFVILATLSCVVYQLLKEHLGSFKIPIVVYMCIISVMAVFATSVIHNPTLKRIATFCFIPGAALFVLSDALLAMNKFMLHESLVDMGVMLTYGLAQLFLVKGFIRVTAIKSALTTQ